MRQSIAGNFRGLKSDLFIDINGAIERDSGVIDWRITSRDFCNRSRFLSSNTVSHFVLRTEKQKQGRTDTDIAKGH